jgi:hypothetical protein
MRMKAIGFKLQCLLLATFLAGETSCSRKKAGRVIDAHLSANTYTNSYFGFSLKTPAGWAVLNRAEIENPPPPSAPKQIRNPVDGLLIAIPDVEIYNLITVVERTNLFPDVTTTAMASTNIVLSVLAQDVSWNRDVHTGKDYLQMIFGIYDIVAPPGQRVQNAGPAEVEVGGRKFYRDTFHRTYKDIRVNERVYARLESRHALVFVLSAPTEGELDQLEQIIGTVSFH